MKVLIMARAKNQVGGVVSFVDLLLDSVSSDIVAERFVIGARVHNPTVARRALVTMCDTVSLVRLGLSARHDVVHLNPSMNLKAIMRDGAALLVLRMLGARRIIIFLHGWDQAFADKVSGSFVWRWFFRHTFQKAAQVVVLATRFKEELTRIGLSPLKITVSTTMFDGRIFDATQRTEASGVLRVLFLSRITKEKGIYELLEGFRLANARAGSIELVVAGNGPELEGAKRWTQAHALSRRVRFFGFVRGRDKAALLRSASIFAFPTYHGEGCPISLLEAMAAGLAVITTKVGGIPDIITSGENGILLDSVSGAAIASALCDLIMNRETVKRMGRHNEKQAWAKYEANVVTKSIESMYRKMRP